uniref:Transmembrane protein 170B n=2 Tax=Apteryx TaxID=8821 RepID=A0A8B9PKI0_APTOW
AREPRDRPAPSPGDASDRGGDVVTEAAAAAVTAEEGGDGVRAGLAAGPHHRVAPWGRPALLLSRGGASVAGPTARLPPAAIAPSAPVAVLDVSPAAPRPLRRLPALFLLLAAAADRPLRSPAARGHGPPRPQGAAAVRAPRLRRGEGEAVGPPAKMKVETGDNSMINLSVQQVLSLWAHGTVLRNLTEMWYWVFLWALFSSLFVHGALGVLMFVMLQRHRQGRLISVIMVSIGFLGSVTGAMITSAAVAGIYRVAGKNMAPLEALVFGVGQTVLTLIISFSRILATL